MTTAAARTIEAQLRAAGVPWVLGGVDHAPLFAADLAARGVSTLAGARLVKVGTVRVSAPWSPVTADADGQAPMIDAPAYRVQFAGGLRLGYGDGSKRYSEATLKPYTQAIARNTAGKGAVWLEVVDLGGGAAGFVPRWYSTSDKSDIAAIVAGIAAVVTAGFTLGAAPAAATAATPAAAAPGLAVETTAAGFLGEGVASGVPAWDAAATAAGVPLAGASPGWLDALQAKLTQAGQGALLSRIKAALAGQPAAPGQLAPPGATDQSALTLAALVALGVALVI